MTEPQMQEAVGQMVFHCRHIMEAYKLGIGDYQSLTARECLRTLGYQGEEVEEVLRYIAAGGFDYCLDHRIRMTGHHEASGEYPEYSVCYWGADQLESRLCCLRNVPRQFLHRY